MRTKKEIDEQIDMVIDGDVSKFPGMAYEEGVRAALEWVVEDTEDKPMDDD